MADRPDAQAAPAAAGREQGVALDAARYRAAVTDLASERMQGRRVGTTGGRRAIAYMQDGFRSAGLLPPPGRGDFVQAYEHRFHGRTTGGNVIGVLPGQDPELGREVVVVTAHHDHLGFNDDDGCPEGHAGNRLRPGANDNATGAAALLELARAFGARAEDLRRTVVFLSTDGEECGCTGSIHYVFDDPVLPLEATVYSLNIDQIGEGAELVTHTRRNSGEGREDCEVDGEVFARRGIPAQTLVGDNANFHTPRDTVDQVDFDAAFAVVERAYDLLWQKVNAETP